MCRHIVDTCVSVRVDDGHVPIHHRRARLDVPLSVTLRYTGPAHIKRRIPAYQLGQNVTRTGRDRLLGFKAL
jgi:hypothetical protein